MIRTDETNLMDEGEIVNDVDTSALATLNKSEIDQQVATAKKYPRSIKKFLAEAETLATLDEETAEQCIYALPRAGKTIEGPSARMAEILVSSWGNARAAAQVVSEDEEFVVSRGMFYDLEKNVAIAVDVRRRITDSKGKRYNSDMIGTTSNAANSISMRNAILKGIPKALWNAIYKKARLAAIGDAKTLVNKRVDMITYFGKMGVTPAMVFALLKIQGIEDISLDHLATLKGIANAIKEGEATIEDAFFVPAAESVTHHKTAETAAKSASALDEIKARHGVPSDPKTQPSTQDSQGQTEPAQTESPSSQAPAAPVSNETSTSTQQPAGSTPKLDAEQAVDNLLSKQQQETTAHGSNSPADKQPGLPMGHVFGGGEPKGKNKR